MFIYLLIYSFIHYVHVYIYICKLYYINIRVYIYMDVYIYIYVQYNIIIYYTQSNPLYVHIYIHEQDMAFKFN